MSAADRLREAARVLREKATFAIESVDWGDDTPDLGTLLATRRVTALAASEQRYLALVGNPLVGLSLADWLDAQAKHIAMYYCATQCEPDGCDETKAALRVADLILGGVS